jgi:hypothetical protein
MNSAILAVALIGVVLGIAVVILCCRISRDTQLLTAQAPFTHTHLHPQRGRKAFDKIGIEIVNGAIAHDTVYIAMRSGTFGDEFTHSLQRFRTHSGTRLVIVVPDREVFLSNCRRELVLLLTELYENPNCSSARILLLDPGRPTPSEGRKKGYLFVSNGHIHEDDDGFYTNTPCAASFVLGYLKAMIASGTRIHLQPGTDTHE